MDINANGTGLARDGTEPPRNGTEPPRNGAEPPRNGTEPSRNGTEPFGDGAELSRDEALEFALESLRQLVSSSNEGDLMIPFIINGIATIKKFAEGLFNVGSNAVSEGNGKMLSQIEDLIRKLKDDMGAEALNFCGEYLSAIDDTEMIEYTKKKFAVDKVRMKKQGRSSITITTVHGKLTYTRNVFVVKNPKVYLRIYANGKKDIVPLDNFLGVGTSPFKMSINTMLLCSYVAKESNSYKHAEEQLKNYMGLSIDSDTIRRVMNTIGEIQFDINIDEAEEIDKMRKAGTLPKKDVVKDITYIMPDGSYVWTILSKMQGMKDQLEALFGYKEVKLAVIFKESDIVRGISKHGKKTHKITHYIVVPYLGEVDQFKKLVFASAYQNGYTQSEDIVIIGDGADWINDLEKTYFPGATRILDKFHLCENIHTFAAKAYSTNEKARKYFVTAMIEYFEKGQPNKALNLMMLRDLCDVKYNDCVNLYDYIVKNKNYVNYPEYIKKGYFIGSGFIESLNKSFVQRRLKEPGMRWYADNANYVLLVRAMAKNGQWDKFANSIEKYYFWENQIDIVGI